MALNIVVVSDVKFNLAIRKLHVFAPDFVGTCLEFDPTDSKNACVNHKPQPVRHVAFISGGIEVNAIVGVACFKNAFDFTYICWEPSEDF
jgi:hypothetical protein